MGSKKKEDIKKDLIKFSKGKDYYAKIGKAWKRGYLLYGPPGTGKSTMIASIANFLDYDVYDLELTTVKDNSELRKLLIDTTAKSIIVRILIAHLILQGRGRRRRRRRRRRRKMRKRKRRTQLLKRKRRLKKKGKVVAR